jgi:hypothetical protein
VGEAEAIRGLVRLISDGLRRRSPERELVAQLVAAGIPEGQAPELLVAVRQAIQAGVQAEFTGGLSAPDGPPADPLLAEAFRVGRSSFRGAVRQAWLERLVVPLILLVLLVVGVVAWLLWR